MAGRETGVVRKRLSGESAAPYMGIARTQLGILKNLMSFQDLKQLSRTIKLSDGTTIFVSSIFGQDTIRIDAPEIVEVGGEEVSAVSAVNRVADYVGVAMPNPVPYRGVSIGVVQMVYAYTSQVLPPPINSNGNTGYAQQNTLHVYEADGAEVATYSGTFTYNFPTTGIGVDFEYVNWPGGPLVYGQVSNTPVGFLANGGDNSTSGTLISTFTLSAITTISDTARTRTVIMVSDGTVLASEVYTNYVPDTTWNGDTYVNMYVDSTGGALNHQLTFTVPEDCIYLAPTTPPAVFNTRRKAWFKKNSDEFIAALKGNFQPGATGVTRAELQTGSIPASWDYQIKVQYGKNYSYFTLADGSRPGRHTKMPITMTVIYVDTVKSDTSAGLSQAGTMVTQRAATFTYIDANGVNQTTIVNGTLTQVVVQYQPNYDLTTQSTYLNWYSSSAPAWTEALLKHQFLKDRASTSDAALWNGVVQDGYNATSALGIIDNPMTYVGYIPAFPVASNTLVGTAAPIYLQYHDTVLPQYVKNTDQSSTVMNNSGLYNVKQIELCLFGPAPGGQAIGIFPDPTDADGATQIAYYGEASLLFDWSQGKLTVRGWKPRKDTNGNDAPTIISMPAGYSCMNDAGTLYFVEYAVTAITTAATNIITSGGTQSAAATAAAQQAYNRTLASVGATGGDAAGNIVQTAVKAAVKGAATTDNKTIISAITAALPAAIIQAIAAANVARAAVTPTPPLPLNTVALTMALQHTVAAYNCAIGYVWDSPDQMWPDVAEYLRAKIAQMVSGGGDQVLYTIIKQALAL